MAALVGELGLESWSGPGDQERAVYYKVLSRLMEMVPAFLEMEFSHVVFCFASV